MRLFQFRALLLVGWFCSPRWILEAFKMCLVVLLDSPYAHFAGWFPGRTVFGPVDIGFGSDRAVFLVARSVRFHYSSVRRFRLSSTAFLYF